MSGKDSSNKSDFEFNFSIVEKEGNHLSSLSIAIAILILPLISLPIFAQGTKADYERANNLAQRVSGKTHRSNIKPNWIGETDSFWYMVETGQGKHEFVLVDPDKAEKRAAFDHAKLAHSLSVVLKKEIDPERLPVQSIAFPKKGFVLVQVSEKSWNCDLNSYELTEVKSEFGRTDAFSPQSAPRASTTTGAETGLTFQNQLKEDVSVFWLDSEGKRQPFGTLKPDESREQHTYAGHVWLIANKNGEPIVVFVATEHPTHALIDGTPKNTPVAPRRRRVKNDETTIYSNLSPDKSWRISLIKGNVALMSGLDKKSEAPLTLTNDGKTADAYDAIPLWSPDSKHFVVMQTIPAQEHKVSMVESSPKDQEQPKLFVHDYLKPGDIIAHPRPRLFSLTAQIPLKEELFSNPWEISQLRWEPDSAHFTFLYNQRGHQAMRLIRVDAETGEAKAIINEEAKTFIDWTNKVYLSQLDKTHEAIWMSERDGWNHLYLYDASSGKVKNRITKGEWVVRGVDRIDEMKRQIWFRCSGIDPKQDPYHVHYARINFDGSGLTMLTEGDGTHLIEYSPSGKRYTDTYSRVDLPPVVELRESETGNRTMTMEKADTTDLIAAGFSFPERFVAKARDGVTDIWGVIVRPSNFDPTKKYPVLENIYAGPQGSFVPKSFSPSSGMQALAELGFIVVQMDGMGTNNRSKVFHDVCWHNLGDAGFPDRILWHKAAAAKYPYMDLTRVGIYGTSAGGQNALGGLLTHGDFYKAGMADCGCHDNRMDKIWWNEQWMGYPIGPHYEAQSNVALAHNLTGELLLMVGEMDTNVDPASTMQVVNALIKADKDFELLVVPGAGHGVAGSPYGKRRVQDFFVKTLLGVEPRRE